MSEPVKLDIHERDIEPGLCRICAACCRITFRLQDTNTRYRKFLRQVGYTLLPPPAAGLEDCCSGRHNATVDMGYCHHLDIKQHSDGNHYSCRIYGTSELPELCAEFNCVSWAKANDSYGEKNTLLMTAQRAMDRQRGRQHGD